MDVPPAKVLSDCKDLVPLHPKPTGRPTVFSTIRWERILEGAELGEFLTQTCARLKAGDPARGYGPDPDFPTDRTVQRWVDADVELLSALVRARKVGNEKILEDTVAIADDNLDDYVVTAFGPRLNAEHVSRSKLRIEARYRMLKIRDPDRFGDKAHVTHANDKESPLVHNRPQTYTDDELRAIIAAAAAAKTRSTGE